MRPAGLFFVAALFTVLGASVAEARSCTDKNVQCNPREAGSIRPDGDLPNRLQRVHDDSGLGRADNNDQRLRKEIADRRPQTRTLQSGATAAQDVAVPRRVDRQSRRDTREDLQVRARFRTIGCAIVDQEAPWEVE
jgi:hypothetical protein